MERTECFETSAYKIQTPGHYPEENIQHTEHGESLKSRIFNWIILFFHSLSNSHIVIYSLSRSEDGCFSPSLINCVSGRNDEPLYMHVHPSNHYL
jgi:hypothetical protein